MTSLPSPRPIRARTRTRPASPTEQPDLTLYDLVGLGPDGKPTQAPPPAEVPYTLEQLRDEWMDRPWPRCQLRGVFMGRRHAEMGLHIVTYRRPDAPGRGWCFAIREADDDAWIVVEEGYDTERDAKLAAFYGMLDSLPRRRRAGRRS